MQYQERVADQQLREYLASLGGVLIEGPRACGKTSTALQQAKSVVRLDESPELLKLADISPAMILSGERPRLIDEWQLAPSIWNAARHEIDSAQEPGQLILSGSATPQKDTTRHSGAGRFARLRMRTMSLAESGVSTGEISLQALRQGDQISAHSPLSYVALAEQAVRGGWPGYLHLTSKAAQLANRTYLDNIVDVDVQTASGVRHQTRNVRALMGSLARNISQELSYTNLARDLRQSGDDLSTPTIASYLESLSQVFIFDLLPAWSVSLRSKSRLRTSEKIHLADPSLALASLGVGPDRLARDPAYFGQVFESMAIRDVRAYASVEFGRVYHYRDNTGLELDAIIEYPDGGWAAAEVKLGSSQIPAAENNLLKLRDERVDTASMGQPRFLAVITGTEYAYTLPSGVHVIPLGVLRW